MKISELRHRLHTGKTVFGTLIVSPSPRWPKALLGCGLDFVFIDTEHIAIDRETLSWMCHAYEALGLSPIVRLTSPDPYAATMVLDGGAVGVIAPYVESIDQVIALRGATKMRPIKGQKLLRMLGGESAGPLLDTYIADAATERLLIINIESVPAIQSLDAMLDVPGLDSVLIGPHDLSCSLGIPEQYGHPDFLAACEMIFRKARAKNCGAGIHFWGDVDEQVRLIGMGANMLIHSADLTLFKKHLTAELASIRKAVGEKVAESRYHPSVNI